MSDINPLRPNQTNLPNAQAGGDGLRNAYDQRGGKGGNKGGGKKDEKPEPEATSDEAGEEEGKLDADSFSGRKSKAVIDSLFADALPWETEEGQLATKLEELKRKREELAKRGGKPLTTPTVPPRAGTGGLVGAKGGAPTGTGSLGGLKIPPVPTQPPAEAPRPVARRPGGEAFDATAAVNQALLAQQELRERAAAREREHQAHQAQGGDPNLPGLAKLLRPGAGTRSPSGRLQPLDDGGPLTAPARPEIEVIPLEPRAPSAEPPRGTGGLKVRLPTTAELVGSQPEAAPPPAPRQATGKLPARPAVPPRAQIPARPEPGAAGAAAEAGKAPADVRKAPGRGQTARPVAADATATDAAAGVLEARVPAAAPTPPPALEPPPFDAIADLMPAPDLDDAPFLFDDDDAAAAPAAEAEPAAPARPAYDDGAPAPKVKPGQVSAACVYRVIDVATNKPLAGARVELEPLRDDDMLPNVHGQADMHGWYGTEGLPPGEYRVTVRSPGYVPVFKVRVLEAGMLDDLAIFIARP